MIPPELKEVYEASDATLLEIAGKYADPLHPANVADMHLDHGELCKHDYMYSCDWEEVLVQHLVRKLQAAIGHALVKGVYLKRVETAGKYIRIRTTASERLLHVKSFLSHSDGCKEHEGLWRAICDSAKGRAAILQGLTERCGADSPIRKWSKSILYDINLLRKLMQAF